jgi:hypothetical protein
MQINFPGADQTERKVIRTWRIGVVIFYGSIFAMIILLSVDSNKGSQSATSAHTPSSFETATVQKIIPR